MLAGEELRIAQVITLCALLYSGVGKRLRVQLGVPASFIRGNNESVYLEP